MRTRQWTRVVGWLAAVGLMLVGLPGRVAAQPSVPPAGWTQWQGAGQALFHPEGGAPWAAGSGTPYLYVARLAADAPPAEEVIYQRLVALDGHQAQQDEPPLAVQVGPHKLLGQFTGGIEGTTSYRAYVGVLTEAGGERYLVLAHGPAATWAVDAALMHTLLAQWQAP